MTKLLLAIISCVALTACGDGAMKRLTTLAGIYEVVHPGGFPVVCFVEATHGGVFCITDKALREGK